MEGKPSIFNHSTKNKRGELLLYNSYHGLKSLCKVSSERACAVEKWLNGTSLPVSPQEEGLLEQLHRHGFFVEKGEREEDKLRLQYLRVVNDGGLYLTVMPTEQCNFRCVYCNEPFQKGAMSLGMQNALIGYLRKQLHRYNRLDIAWFGGEPLLAVSEIAYMSQQFIKLCRAVRIPYSSNITTNGYLLTPENLHTLIKECHVTSFQVTVDGLADTHNRQKPLAGGGKTFETVLGNLRYIRDHVQTRLIRIVIRTNITREIYEKLDDYIDFFADEFGEDERFSFFIRPAMDWGGESIASFKGELVDDRAVPSVYQRLIQRERLKRFDSHLGFFAVGGTVCAAAKHNFYTIEPDGKLHKCSQMFDDDFDTEVGQLYEDGSVYIDDYKAAQWLLDTSSCSQKDCFFAGNCLSEFCPKLRLSPQKRHACPHEMQNIDLTMQLLDLDESTYTKLGY